MSDSEDRKEYEGWVERWSDDLFRFGYRLCGRRDLAEDLVQETFFHAWRSRGKLRERARARAWLFQILRFRWSHVVRSEVRRPIEVGGLDAAEGVAGDGEGALEGMVRSETLGRALGAIDERYRLPLLMVFLEGKTCRETAEELGVPLGTVLSRIHRGKAAVKEAMGDEWGLDGEGGGGGGGDGGGEGGDVAADEDGSGGGGGLRFRGEAI